MVTTPQIFQVVGASDVPNKTCYCGFWEGEAEEMGGGRWFRK